MSADLRRAAAFDGVMVLADDDPRWKHDPLACARAACAGGGAIVQLRTKHATDPEALRLAREIRAITRGGDVGFTVNDRFDLALAAAADGVHLGQDDLPPDAIPAALRPRLAVGRSTHSLEQALAAAREPIDYLAFGPIFGTDSKLAADPPRGLDRLAEVVARVAPLPVVAIGGISIANAAEVARTGARGVAVISAVAAAPDPAAATSELVAAFCESRPS